MAKALRRIGRREANGRRPYRSRFALAYGVLGVLLLGGLAALALLAGRDDDPTEARAPASAVETAPGITAAAGAEDGERWSDFKSDAEGLELAQAIGNHVARHYRGGDGKNLVRVVAGVPSVGNEPATGIAIRRPDAGDLSLLPASGTLVYMLCGDAPNCSLPTGAPSPERGALLRRESLELALSAFYYMPAVGSVLVYMPKPLNAGPQWALFYQRDQWTPLLERPLRATLPAGVSRVRDIANVNRDPIDQAVRRWQFRVEPQQLQNGNSLLVLEPAAAS